MVSHPALADSILALLEATLLRVSIEGGLKPRSAALNQASVTAQPQSRSIPMLYMLPVLFKYALVTTRKKPRSPQNSPHELRAILHAGKGRLIVVCSKQYGSIEGLTSQLEASLGWKVDDEGP